MSESFSSHSHAASAESKPLGQSVSDTSTGMPISAGGGMGYRVDSAHAEHSHSSFPTTSHAEDLLVQASQIAENLRQQMDQFNQREESLRQQFEQLEQERNNIRQWANQHEKSMLVREDQLHNRGVELSQQFRACEKLVTELEQQEASLLRASEQLEAGRENLRHELDSELDVDREALQRAQEAVANERLQLSELIEKNNRSRVEAFEEGRREWKTKQQELRTTLLDEVREEFTSERAEISEERSRWEMLRDAQYEDLTERKEQTDAELKQIQTELAEARIRHMQDLEAEREDHFRRIEESVEEFEHQQKLSSSRQEAEKAEWTAQKRSEQEQIDHERELNTQAIQKAEEEIKNLRVTIQSELQQAKEKQKEKLLAEQEAFEAEQEQLKKKLQQEQGIFENRMRFQQDHLTKLRQELEQVQKDIRIEQQQYRQTTEKEEKQSRLRAEQLVQHRQLLEKREASINRTEELLNKDRQVFDVESSRDKIRFKNNREAWEEERLTQRADIKRQQEMLTLHAENLEGRKERLDRLRNELEETHQETLTMKMALEEAWAQFSQAAGSEVSQQKIEESRRVLDEYYQQVQKTCAQQRDELSRAQTEFNQQQAAFREEQKRLADWMNDREDKFQVWEESLRRDTKQLETSITNSETYHDKWMKEKFETENIIRDLLQQLSGTKTAQTDVA